MSVADLRRLATVEAAVEARTAFGGVSRLWIEIAQVWIALDPPAVRQAFDPDRPPSLAVAAVAQARDDLRVRPGQRLVLGGDKWRLVRVDRAAPMLGRMTLHLEKDD